MRRALAKQPLSLLFISLLVATAVLIWGGLSRGHHWGDDFAAYIMQAQSLVEGQPGTFVASNRYAMEHSSRAIGPFAYPWGFPLMLAPMYAIFGFDLMAFKAVPALCFLLLLVVIWFGFRKYHSAPGRLLCVGLVAFNPALLQFTDRILSDLPFVLLSTLSLVLMGRLVVDGRRLISPVGDYVLLGACLASAFLVRSNGILLVATLVVAQAIAGLQRPHLPRIALRILPYSALAVVVLAVIAISSEGGASYLSHLRSVSLSRVSAQLHYYIDLPRLFFTGVPHAGLIYGATIPLVLVGAYRRARIDHHVMIYTILTVLMYVVWPGTQGLRFLFPLFPFYVSFVVSSLEGREGAADAAAPGRWRRALPMVPALVVLFYFVRISTAHVVDNLSRDRVTTTGPFTSESRAMFSFIESTPPDSIIVFFKPRALTLLTGRASIMIDRADQLPRGDYVSHYRRRDAYNQVRQDHIERLAAGGLLHRVYQNDDFDVFKVARNVPRDISRRI